MNETISTIKQPCEWGVEANNDIGTYTAWIVLEYYCYPRKLNFIFKPMEFNNSGIYSLCRIGDNVLSVRTCRG